MKQVSTPQEMTKTYLSEEKVEALVTTLPYGDEFAIDLYHHIQHCAELMNVSPSLLNCAIGFVGDRTHMNPDEFIQFNRTLELVLEYVHEERK